MLPSLQRLWQCSDDKERRGLYAPFAPSVWRRLEGVALPSLPRGYGDGEGTANVFRSFCQLRWRGSDRNDADSMLSLLPRRGSKGAGVNGALPLLRRLRRRADNGNCADDTIPLPPQHGGNGDGAALPLLPRRHGNRDGTANTLALLLRLWRHDRNRNGADGALPCALPSLPWHGGNGDGADDALPLLWWLR